MPFFTSDSLDTVSGFVPSCNLNVNVLKRTLEVLCNWFVLLVGNFNDVKGRRELSFQQSS